MDFNYQQCKSLISPRSKFRVKDGEGNQLSKLTKNLKNIMRVLKYKPITMPSILLILSTLLIFHVDTKYSITKEFREAMEFAGLPTMCLQNQKSSSSMPLPMQSILKTRKRKNFLRQWKNCEQKYFGIEIDTCYLLANIIPRWIYIG